MKENKRKKRLLIYSNALPVDLTALEILRRSLYYSYCCVKQDSLLSQTIADFLSLS